MKNKNTYLLFTYHGLFFLAATVLFVSLFHTPLLTGVGVFFYRGIGLLIITAIILFICLILFRKTRNGKIFLLRDIVFSVVVFFSLLLTFFTHGPITAERSVSVFILGFINAQSVPVNESDILNAITSIHLERNDGVQKRLDEQVASGTLLKEEDGYVMSDNGKFLLRVYDWIIRIFGISLNSLNK